MSEGDDASSSDPDSATSTNGSGRSEPPGASISSWMREVRFLGRTPLDVPGELGPYQLLDVLGRGGMGAVYRAFDRRVGRDVALKIQDSLLASESAAIAYQEARALARLAHPSIVRLLALEEIDGRLLVAMELVRGTTLRARLQSTPAPRTGERLRWCLDLLGAMAEAHAAGVVHRDLKPGNMLVDADGRLRVVDFGLAHLSPAEQNAPLLTGPDPVLTPSSRVGTRGYTAPEQQSGTDVDARADVYAMGLVLFEILTGARPRTVGRGRLDRSDRLRLLRRLPGTGWALARVLGRATAALREERWQDAAALDAAFQRALGRGRTIQISTVLSAVLAIVLAGASALGLRTSQSGRVQLVDRPLGMESRGLLVGMAIAPDGRFVAYTDSLGTATVLALDGGERARWQVHTELRAEHVSWRGERTLVLSGVDRTGESFVEIRPDLGRSFEASTRGEFGAGSPNGDRVAFLRGGELIVDDSTHGERRVASVRHLVGVPLRWDPDGERVLVAPARPDAMLEVVDVASGSVVPVRGPGPTVQPDLRIGVWWTRQGLLLVERRDGGADLVIAPLVETGDGGYELGARQLVARWPEVGASGLTVSADGARATLLVVSVRHRNEVRAIEDGGRLVPVELPHQPRARVSDWIDDETLAVTASQDLGWASYLVRSGGIERIGEGEHASWVWPVRAPGGGVLAWRYDAPADRPVLFSLNDDLPRQVFAIGERLPTDLPPLRGARLRCGRVPGAGCVLARWRDGVLRFDALDPAEGELAPMFSVEGQLLSELVFDVSTDGRHVVHATSSYGGWGVDGVTRWATQDACERVHRLAWDPAGRGVWAILERDLCDGTRSLVVFGPDGEPEVRETFGVHERPVYLAVSPSGTRLAWTVSETLASPHLLELAPTPP